MTFEYFVSITQLQLPKQYPELTAVTSRDPNKSYSYVRIYMYRKYMHIASHVHVCTCTTSVHMYMYVYICTCTCDVICDDQIQSTNTHCVLPTLL